MIDPAKSKSKFQLSENLMRQIELAYGLGSVALTFDEDRYQVLGSDGRQEQPLTDVQIGEALDLPFESAPLEEILGADDSVLIVVSDATRATGSAQIVNLLVRRIIQIGIEPPEHHDHLLYWYSSSRQLR